MNQISNNFDNCTAVTNKRSSSDRYIWFLFLLTPILSIYPVIKNYRFKNIRKFIVLLGGVYGLTFVPIPNSDGTRFATSYIEHFDYSFTSYLNDIGNIFGERVQFPDIYAYTLFYLGNLVTNNAQFFFMIVGLIYFSVFIKLVNSFYDKDVNILKKDNSFFFIGIIFLLNFSAGLSGVRWPLGLIIFLYGSYNAIVKNQANYILIAATSMLVHFALAPAVAFLVLFHYVPLLKNRYVLFALIGVSFAIGGILLSDNSAILGDVLEDKLDAYTGEGYSDRRASNSANWNWYVPVAHLGAYYFSLGAIFLMWIRKSKISTDQTFTNLLSVATLMISVSFIVGGVVDIMTNRYTILVVFFTLATLVYLGFIDQKSKFLKTLKYIYLPLLIIKVLVSLRVDIQTISFTFLTNPFFEFFL